MAGFSRTSRRNTPLTIIELLKRLFLITVFLVLNALPCFGSVKARYVRVDNPTGLVFRCRQFEVYSGGENILLNHPEQVIGTTHTQPDNKNPTRENTIVGGRDVRACTDITNGDTDTSHWAEEWITYRAPGAGYEWGPWFEIDLGEEVEIDKVVFYGAAYPNTFYVDKGHRTICTMDAERNINWAVHWQYYDKETYPDGVFAFETAKMTKKDLPFLGRHIPERSLDWVPMGWILEADEEIRPVDAKERLARFAERNSPAEVEKLAKEFFTILDPSTPGLAGAFESFEAGKYGAALDAWKVYWFAKMEKVNQFQALNHNKTYSACGDDLLEGLMVTIMSNEAKAIRFTPGCIRWIVLPDRDDPEFRQRFGRAWSDCERKACIGSTSWPLLYSFRRNPDPKYVECWAEIMDDWAMNFFVDSAKEPYEVENLFTFSPGHDWCQTMEDLSKIAVEQPSLIDFVPSTTLARAQMIALEKYTTAWWRQARETNFNHNTGGFYAYEPIVNFYIDEFLPGQRAAKEWRETFERFLVLGNFRDGSLTEIGDEGHMEIPTLMNVIMNRVEHYADKPEWFTPGWRNHFYEWSDNMLLYMYRHLAPGGYEHRDRPDYRTYRWTSTTKPYWVGRPTLALDRDKEILHAPEMQRMLGVWGFVSTDLPEPNPPTYPQEMIDNRWKNVRETMREFFGDTVPGKPELLSDWMPYYGGYYFRGGWELDDAFVHMTALGACGGTQPQLYPYTWYYMYDHNFPMIAAEPLRVRNSLPLQVHGKEHRINPGTKTNFLIGADENPHDFRWTSSPRLDFGEAVFEGAYGNFPGFRGDWDDTSLEMAPLPEAVENIRTVRQIVQLRKQRLFLVFDRTESKDPDAEKHELSIMYKPALSSKRDTEFQIADRLERAPREEENAPKTVGLIRSVNPDGPAVTMYQFADQPICYRLEREAQPDFGRYACRIGGGIGIAEPSVRMIAHSNRLAMVSLLASREMDGEDRVVSIKPYPENSDEIVGFRAKIGDGSEVICQMSRNERPVEMTCGPFKATAQLLLAVSENKEFSGFVLGAKSMTFNKKGGSVKNSDFEFFTREGALRSNPILRPIKPVVFKPNRTVFAGSETVEMVCETPDVEIRYTTDGTPPDRDSKLYTDPITITETTEFAARAYRLRNGKPIPPRAEDFELNGTKFTVPSYGFFRKVEPKPAIAVAKSGLKPGLQYEYLEAPWWKLYASGHWLPAETTGQAARELDLSSVSTNKAYCMRYKGYIEIPEDGVYTFHAPEEIAQQIGAASYDLRLYLDGEEWSISQFWHGHGTWSVPLEKGLHRFELDFADARTKPWNRSGIWRFYPRPWTEHQGPPSDILISGPGLEGERIPVEWFSY